MCENCYEEYGSPRIENDRVYAAAAIIASVFDEPGSGCGGGLHIVIDDWNLEDRSIEWCQTNGLKSNVEKLCAATLLALSLDERASALAIVDEYFVPLPEVPK